MFLDINRSIMNTHRHNREVDYTCWGCPDRAEPTTPNPPSTLFIAVDVSVDPTAPSGVATARIPMEPVPYSEPDGLQDGVIEPTAVFKPWLRSTDWDNVEITVEYYD